jgi:hypothetical protein
MFVHDRKRTAYHVNKDKGFFGSVTIGMFDLQCRALKLSILHTWDRRKYVVKFDD